MLATMLIAGTLFAAMIAILYFGYADREKQREEARFENVPTARPGRCILCNAPLRRPATSDQAIFEVQHRIDAELSDISTLLKSSQPVFSRLYEA